MTIDPDTLPNTVDELKAFIVQQAACFEQLLGEKQHLVDQLLEQIRLHKTRQFKPQSEQLAQLQLANLFNEIEALAIEEPAEPQPLVTVITRPAAKRGRKRLPAELPREVITHDLSEDQRVCDCGNPLHRIGEERCEKLEIVPMQLKVIEHVRPKYACRACENGVSIQPLPPQPIPRSIATVGLLAFICTAKFVDHLPLYRIEQMLKRHGVALSRTTQAHWMIRIAQTLAPLYVALQMALRERDYLHVDETRLQVLKEPDRPAQRKSYMWVYLTGAGPPIVLFDYQQTRGAVHPKRFLGDDYAGYLQVDGLSSYRALTATSEERISQIGCLAHVRRKFVEAEKVAPAKKKAGSPTRGQTAISLIARLYHLEKQWKALTPEQRRDKRQAEAKPLFDALMEWCQSMSPKVSTKSVLGAALRYANTELPLIAKYLDDGRLWLDNTPVERQIKPFVIGRKSWMFSDSVEGAQASAVLYSIVQSAKENGVEPYAYLRDVLQRLACDDRQVDTLLPWNWGPEQTIQKPSLAA